VARGADTEGFYTEVQEKILARYGKVFDWSLKAKMMGKKATESARIFVDECGLNGLLTPEEFLEERESMLQALFPSCTKLPGEPNMNMNASQKLSLCRITIGLPLCIIDSTILYDCTFVLEKC
jgi:hypothetical protein